MSAQLSIGFQNAVNTFPEVSLTGISVNAKGELFDDGKFLVLWKKTKNGWKMFRDSFSSNHPPK